MNIQAPNVQFTGSIPENYDTYLGPVLFEFSSADLARRVHAQLERPARILEIACGTGISTRHLAHTLPEGTEIVATDLNEAMLSHAEAVNPDLPGVTWSQADALDLPFDDQGFDAVVCQFGIMFFPDKELGVQEMNRVLKPGGLLALNVWDSFEHNPSVGVIDTVIKSFFKTDPPRFLEVPFGYYDTQACRDLLSQNGFVDVEHTYVCENVETLDHAHPARGFVIGNPTILEIEKHGNIDAEMIVAEASAALEREFGPAPARLSFQEIVYLARRTQE
jgi:ubiquinone/menaquinone biosynthesis C-methylase UbiE